MLLDRTHRKWFFVSAVILAVATAGYVVYANRMPNGPRGGSVVGLIFGIVGSLMMTFAGLLAGRKQFPIAQIPIPLTGKRLRLGSAQFWLRGHIWLGLLSVPMILFHSGFAWGGLVENLLWITFGGVVLSGLYGLVVQQVFPRFLTSRVPMETFVQQIPYQCTRTKILSDRMVAEACGKLDITGDPLFPVFAKISEFYSTAGKDDKDKWIDMVGDEHRSLFLDLATHAKQSRLIRMEADFARFLDEVYVGIGSGDGARPAAAKPAAKASAADAAAEADAPAGPAGKKPSPLERARAQAGQQDLSPGGGNGDAASDAPAATPSGKPLSKLEQARAAARDQGGAEAKSSPPERSRQPASAAGPGGKPLSKLEQARAAAADKGGGAAAPAAAVSAKSAPAATPAPAAPAPAVGAQPLSPAEVEQEVGKARDLLKNEYGYDDERANFAAEQPRKFLAPETAKPAAAELPRAKRAKARHRANMNRSMTISDFIECVELACPFCEFEVQLRDKNLLGRPARCPNCREKFLLIEPEDAALEPAAVAADASPLERARAQAGARRAEAAAPAAAAAPQPPSGKKSPLERAREQAGKQAAKGDPPTPAAKPASPLEKVRAQAAAKGKSPAKAAAEAPSEKPAKAKPMPGVAQKKPAPAPSPAPSPRPAAKKPAAAPAGPIPRTEDLKAFYLGDVRPFLDVRGSVDGQLATTDMASRVFAQMRVELPTELHPILGELEQNCEQRRQFAIQKRIHRWLHWWLAFHIPASAALFVLFVLHVVMALRVTPWAM